MSRTIPKDRFHKLIEASTAVFLDQGYRRTQIADVAARMGVAKGRSTPTSRARRRSSTASCGMQITRTASSYRRPFRFPRPRPAGRSRWWRSASRRRWLSRPVRSTLPHTGHGRTPGAGVHPRRVVRRARRSPHSDQAPRPLRARLSRTREALAPRRSRGPPRTPRPVSRRPGAPRTAAELRGQRRDRAARPRNPRLLGGSPTLGSITAEL